MSKFGGFVGPQENWSKLPHALIDNLSEIGSLAELKVILYTLRHTWGFQDASKKITLQEFMTGRKKYTRDKYGKVIATEKIDNGTGLSKPSVISGIKKAIEHGFLYEYVDDSDKARIKKHYSLIELEDDKINHNSEVKEFNIGGKEVYRQDKKVLHRTEKETNNILNKDNKKIKDHPTSKIPNSTASLPEETSPPSFPQNFEAEILHNDKRLKGEKVMFTRKDNIYEGYVLNQSPRRLTIGVPEGHGLKNMVLNASGNSKMAYRNGKLHRVTWAAPDLSTGLPEPIRTVLKELKETIHPEILKTLNSKQFGYIKEFAIEGCKKGFLSPGRLSEFDNWYRNVKWAWLTGRGEEPSLITYWEIKKYIGHYNIWLQGGKVIPQSTGYKNGKTPFGQGYGLQTKPVAVEANDEVFIPEEF